MTRAKDDLDLVVPQRFFTHGQHAHGDRHVYAARSRFVPQEILHLFDVKAWPARSAVPEKARDAVGALRVDVAARLRDMWR